mgnify:CR=1 FL=1
MTKEEARKKAAEVMKPSELIHEIYRKARGALWISGEIQDKDLFIKCILAYLDEQSEKENPKT